MWFLKVYLLAGLVVHKAVWEVMKRQKSGHYDGKAAMERSNPRTRLIKTVKIAILVGIAAQTMLPDVLPITSNVWLRVLGAVIYSAGLWIAISSRRALGTNWSDIEAGKIAEGHLIVSRGAYRFIRHPIYVGDLLLLFGLELALNSWLVVGVFLLAPVVLRQALHEEKNLVRSLPDYAAYCSSTKRFIPFVV